MHAGPLADDYVTATLPRGASVTVVRHDPGGRAMIQAPAGAVSFARLDWLTMTAGTAEGGGSATVTATGSDLYCRVGSRVGEAPMIEQVPLKIGQAVEVTGTRSLPGPNGPEIWAQIPSPQGEHRWVQLRYLLPANAQARADRDRDPFAVPADLLDAGAPVPGGGVLAGGDTAISSTGTDPFAPAPADAAGSGVVEVAFATPHPLPGAAGATALLADDAAPRPMAGSSLGAAVQTAATDPFAHLGAPATPIVGGSSASGHRPGWSEPGPQDPSRADRFAARGADAVAADRRRLEELDRRLEKLLDADPQDWDLDALAADLRDLRDRASSNTVHRFAQARLVRIDVLRTIRGEYAEYVQLTARTDKRDARLTVEADETLRRFALVDQPYGPVFHGPSSPQTAVGSPFVAPGPRSAAAPGRSDDASSLAAPPYGDIDRMSHTQQMSHTRPARGPAGASPKAAADAPPGAVVFEAVGVLREVTNPPHPQAPRFALVAKDGRVAAYLQDDPRLALPTHVGRTFGVNGRRFTHPDIPAPMVAVTRLVPVRR